MKVSLVFVDTENHPAFAVTTKKALSKIVKESYPEYKRKWAKQMVNEMYYEDNYGGFIRANFHPVALVEVRE